VNPSKSVSVSRLIALVGFCLALLWLAPPAAANDRAAMQACRTDARQLCANVQPGGGRIAVCLRENASKLSSPCQAQLGTLEACAAEMKKLCPQAHGEGELRRCVADKRAELSADCRAAAGG
jgi:Cysteine rich repeat